MYIYVRISILQIFLLQKFFLIVGITLKKQLNEIFK